MTCFNRWFGDSSLHYEKISGKKGQFLLCPFCTRCYGCDQPFLDKGERAGEWIGCGKCRVVYHSMCILDPEAAHTCSLCDKYLDHIQVFANYGPPADTPTTDRSMFMSFSNIVPVLACFVFWLARN